MIVAADNLPKMPKSKKRITTSLETIGKTTDACSILSDSLQLITFLVTCMPEGSHAIKTHFSKSPYPGGFSKECRFLFNSRERLRRVLRKKAAVILHLHTFTSADLHLHTFTSADLDLHTLTPADLDLHTLTPADLDLHTFTSADLDLHTLTSADLDLHTFTPADLDLHTLTPADLDLHTLTSADLDLHTLTPADLDLHTFTSADLLSLFFYFLS